MKKLKQKHRLLILRLFLGLLIVLNMITIFQFSQQDGETSSNTSTSVSQAVAENTVPNFQQKPKEEQTQIVTKINKPLRKLAHMAEFGLLGALIYLLLLTWKGHVFLRYLSALLATFVYACTDEWHQKFTSSRGARFTDVLIDLSGATITCTLVLLAVYLLHKKPRKAKRMQVTHYHVPSPKSSRPLKLALASDLHSCPYERAIELLKQEAPDIILIPGDIMDDKDLKDPDAVGYAFLTECAKIAPSYYSFGNHELRCYHHGNPERHPKPVYPDQATYERLAQTGVTLLHNEIVQHEDLLICGLTSGINGKISKPDVATIERFSSMNGVKLLLCHHPEYFYKYIAQTNIDLTVCGHAHGGQWRIFGRGIYSPGQGLFPKYTSGVLENRCVISRGMGDHTSIPRLFNPRELVIIHWE